MVHVARAQGRAYRVPAGGRDVDVVDDLREHDRGEGAWVDDFQGAMAEAFAQPDSAARDGWETLSQTRRRVVGAVREIVTAYPGRDVVLVGHRTAWTLLDQLPHPLDAARDTV